MNEEPFRLQAISSFQGWAQGNNVKDNRCSYGSVGGNEGGL